MEDTIVAVSTALGVGAISIIRVSGKESIKIVNKIFKGDDLEKKSTHTINYGYIVENNEKIDEVLVMLMKEPRTYTKENIVEINCHGGIATTNKVLEILLKKGCRLANPGEFTKRAFLNGRIDLQHAEGIMDLIESKTELSRKQSILAVSGNVSKLIKELRQEIIEILANIEVNIDFPEYEDIEEMTLNHIIIKMHNIKQQIEKIIKESKNGKIIKEGINVAIIGKPNVGKSSLLNELLEEEKAIVTNIEGTTRDTVEGQINLDGIMLNIIDTAGIRETSDIVEKIGVDKSLKLISTADLILFMINNNEKLTTEEKILFEKIKDKNNIVIVNKTDLLSELNVNDIKIENLIYMSTLNKTGIEELKNKIKEIFNLEQIVTNELTYLTNARSIGILEEILTSIDQIENGIKNEFPIDILEIDLKNIWEKLGEIIGISYKEELIDQLFSQFCLGK
ncbi:MAG: tRNA uridine-5-carboxymethylaminomethyl(34) synthesis GTPase MnmE [Bacilli bacterium]